MIITLARPARPYAPVGDLTTAPVVRRGWHTRADGEEVYELELDGDPGDTIVAAVIRRLTTLDDVDESRVAAMDDTLAELDQFAAGTTTLTLTQLTTVCRRMARVLAAVIRYVRRRT